MLPRWVSVSVLALFAVIASADYESEWGLESDTEAEEVEDMALLQGKVQVAPPKAPTNATEPFLITLQRELSPVIRRGKVVSHRASYSGLIHVGWPSPQEFRVVFDTGSAHVVLPSMKCWSAACLKHVRYDVAASTTGQQVYLDGRSVPEGGVGESVTIGFGTAKVTGDFVRERLCFGASPVPGPGLGPCVTTQAVMATEMSSRPFEQFKFDGIVGLGLPALALNSNFSVFDHVARSGQVPLPHFSFFLAEGDDGEASEIAIGGQNPHHMLEPVSWVPMAKPELGYWQVQILAVHINGTKTDMCSKGDCHGILDSGTSHFGVPSDTSNTFNDLLTVPSGNLKDCRHVDAPTVLLELDGFNVTLYPENYMRLLPIPADILGDANITVSPSTPLQDPAKEEEEEQLSPHPDNSTLEEMLCTPKLLPVRWPEPVGPNIFILGEPVLHRYYTVFDWSGLRAGFALAKHLRPPRRDAKMVHLGDKRQPEDEVVLIQLTLSVSISRL